MDKQLVVARYNEDVSWLDLVDIPAVVYNKGSARFLTRRPVERKLLINVGREAHTYLTHVIANYDNLADVTYFTQGDPFPHAPDFVERLRLDYPETTSLSVGYRGVENDPSDLLVECGGIRARYGKVDVFANAGRTFNRKWFSLLWERLFDPEDKPPDPIFGMGAIYAVPRRRITDRPLTFYLYCRDQTETCGLLNAYAFEVVWHYIWSDAGKYRIVNRYGDPPLPPVSFRYTDPIRWSRTGFPRHML